MTGASALLACGVCALAAAQILANDGAPKIYGGAHLALFARPASQTRRDPSAAGVDYAATATIAAQRSDSGRVRVVSSGEAMRPGAVLRSIEKRGGRWVAIVDDDDGGQSSR